MSQHPFTSLLSALDLAAHRHRDQRRKGAEQTPLINHLIEVAHTLADAGVEELTTLQAALLHDVLEDTETTAAELEERFGEEVRRIVEEVTDDTALVRELRKMQQVSRAPTISEPAKLIKIADHISNLHSIAYTPPKGWTVERRKEYLQWSGRVISGCRGINEKLDVRYNAIYDEVNRVLENET